MNNFLKTTIITSTIALFSSTAMAARFDEGMFIRADVGLGINTKFTSDAAFTPKSYKGSTYGMAVGFFYSSEIAFDLSYASYAKAKVAIASGSTTQSELTSASLLATVTYYINTGFTAKPFLYVGMGLGKARFIDANNNGARLKRVGAGYQLGAGFSFPVSHNIAVELRYRFNYISGKPGGFKYRNGKNQTSQRAFGHSGLLSAKVNF